VTKTAISRHLPSKSRPIRIYYDVTHAGITPPAASRWVARVLSRIVRSVFSGTMPTRCNRTQCGDRHPATWAKWRQRRTQVLCVFRQNRRRRSPHPAPKSGYPTPGIASNVAPRDRIRYWSYLEQMAPRQCGRSSKPCAGSHPREVVPALGCMRSPQGVNGRRAEHQSCAKTVPTRPQAVPSMSWECGSVQSEQRLRSLPPRHLQLLWGGVGAARGDWEKRRAGRTSFRDRNSASTYTAPVGATVLRGARATCCRRNGRGVQP